MRKSMLTIFIGAALCATALAQVKPTTAALDEGAPRQFQREGSWGHDGAPDEHGGHEGHRGHEHGKHGEHGHGHGHWGHEGAHGKPKSEEETLTFLRANYPEKAQQLESQKTAEPERYRHDLAGLGHRVAMWEALQKRDPQGFQVSINLIRAEEKAGHAARAYRKAAKDQKAALKTQLRADVDQLFEARQQAHRQRLEHMKQALAKMETHLQEREAKRASIVDHHVEDLTTEPGDHW